jgi:hypothetical protein
MTSSYIPDLRQRIGDTDPNPAKQVWSDEQLDEWLDGGFSEWTYGSRSEAAGDLTSDDITQGMKLAHSSAMYELATGTAAFFKWKDQQKEFDRSMTPESCRRIGKDLWEQVNQHRKGVQTLVTDEAGRKIAQGGLMQFDPGKAFTDRTVERPWR